NAAGMERRMFLLASFFGALATPDIVAAQSQQPGLEGGAPVPALRRGLNLSHWFAQTRNAQSHSYEPLAGPTTAADVALIRRLGFDHVRLTVDPAPLLSSPT